MAVSQKVLDFNNNEDKMRLKISALEQELSKIYEGGGKAKRLPFFDDEVGLTAAGEERCWVDRTRDYDDLKVAARNADQNAVAVFTDLNS